MMTHQSAHITRMSKAAAAGLAVAIAATLAACGSSGSNESSEDGGGDATITFLNWAGSEDATKDNIEATIAEFEAENDGIQIENQPVPFDQVRQQLLTKFSADDAPCVMQISQNIPFELADQGLLLDLEDEGYADEAWQSEHFPTAIEASRVEGDLVVAPWILSPFGLWFDRDLMTKAGLDPDSPPETFEELQSMIDQAEGELEDGEYALGLDTTNVDVALFQYLTYFLAFGAEPLYDGAPNFDTPEVIEALEFLQKQVADGATPVGQQIRELREMQANGSIMFRMDGPFAAGIFKSLNPDLEEDEAFHERFGVTGIPRGPAGDNGPVANLHQLGISDTCENPDAAWDFVEYLVDSDFSVEEYQLPQGVIPANLEAAESDLASEVLDPSVADVYLDDLIPAMEPGPYSSYYAEATPEVLQAMQRVALENEDVAKVAEETQAQLETIFQ